MNRLDLAPVLRGGRGQRAAAVLVILQLGVGLAIAVLAVQVWSYMGRELDAARSGPRPQVSLVEWMDTGLDAETPAAEARRAERLAAVAAVAGVNGVSPVAFPPLTYFVRSPDELWSDHGPVQLVFDLQGGAGLARALGARLIEGRDLQAVDLHGPQRGVVISRGLADRLFGAGPVVGRRLHSRSHGAAIVVGVCTDMRTAIFYSEISQHVALFGGTPSAAPRTFAVVGHEPGDAERVRRALAELPLAVDSWRDVRPLGGLTLGVRSVLTNGRIMVALLCWIMVLVVLIGSVALTAYLVSTRRREIGLRRALGASRGQVIALFVVENLVLTSLGTAVGLGLVAWMWPMLDNASIGFRLSWPALVGTVAMVWLLGFLASLVPARRAARIPPSVAAL